MAGNDFPTGADADDFNGSYRSDVGRLSFGDLTNRSSRGSFMDIPPLSGNANFSRSNSREGRSSRPPTPSRGYSEPAQILRISHDAQEDVGYSEYDGFELMSASQLREHLQREQRVRKDREDELMALRQSLGSERPASASSSRPQSSGKTFDYAATLMDSDSGIGNGTSTRATRSPMASILHLDDNLHLNSSRHDYQQMPLRTPPPSSIGNEYWNPSSSNVMSVKGLKDALQESEQRRLALVDKLRDAHATLKTQTQRMCEMEARLTEREFAIENYSTTQEGLQRKVAELQRDRDESVTEKIETIRKRERLQQRIEELDHEMKILKSAYNSLQTEHKKRDKIVEQTYQALQMLEHENANALKTRETMIKEAIALRESLQMARAKCEMLERENQELDRIREGRETMITQNAALSAEVTEARQAKDDLQRQVEILDRDYQRTKEERDQFQLRAGQLEDSTADMSSKLASINAEKERLFHERLDLHQRLQHFSMERDNLFKAKHAAEQQQGSLQAEMAQMKMELEKKNEEVEKLEEELSAVKKVGEVLSSEMANAKQNMEKAQEQCRQLQSDKRLAAQQQSFREDEIKRLNSEKEMLTHAMETLKAEHKKDKETLNEQNSKLKEMYKELRNEKNRLQTRCQEVETKLQRANEEVKSGALRQQEESEEWKNTSEKLTATINRKESEIIALSNKLQEANDKNAQLRSDLQATQIHQEQFADVKEELELLQKENKRLTQEHAEDQQVIHLLEMQKNILSKNAPSVNPRFTQEQLQAQVDHLKAELGLSQDKVTELRDELTRVRRASMSDLDHSYSSSDMPRPRSAGGNTFTRYNQLEEETARLREMNKLLSDRLSKADADLRSRSQQDLLRSSMSSLSSAMTNNGQCEKCLDTDDQNTKLRNINKLLNAKVEKLENENDELRYAAPVGEVIAQVEYDRLEKEKDRLSADYDSLKHDYDELESRHRRYIAEHITRALDSPRTPTIVTTPPEPILKKDESNATTERLKRENEEMGRRVDFLQSQVNIADDTKKRAEEKIRKALRFKLASTGKGSKSPSPKQGKLEVEVHDLKATLAATKQPLAVVSDARTHASLTSEIEQKNLIIEKLQREMQEKLQQKDKLLKTMRSEMDNRIAEKDSEIEALKNEKDTLLVERKRLEKLKRDLGMKIDEQNSTIQKFLGEAPQRDANQRKLSEKINQLQSELATTVESSQASQHSYDNKIQHLQDQLTEKQQEVQQMEEMLEQKEEELERLRKRPVFDAEGMEREVTQKIDYLKKLKERQDTQINDLKRRDRPEERPDEMVEGETGARDPEVTAELNEKKEEEVATVKVQLKEVKKECDKKDGMITTLKEELEDEKHSILTPRSKHITQSMDEVSQELVCVKGQLQKVWDMIRIKENQLEYQEQELTAARRQVQTTIDEKETETKALKEQLQVKENQLKELEQKLEAQKNETIILQEMTSAMEDKSFFHYLRKKADDVVHCKECQNKGKTIGNQTRESKRLQDEINSQKEEIEALSDVIKDLERQKQKLCVEKKRLKEEIAEYRAAAERCERLEIDNEQLIVEKEELLLIKEDLERDKEKLHNLLENKRKSRSSSGTGLGGKATSSPRQVSEKKDDAKGLASPRQQELSDATPVQKTTPASLKSVPYPRPSLSSPRQLPSTLTSPRALSSSLPSYREHQQQREVSSQPSTRQSLPSSTTSSSHKKFTLPSTTKFKAAIPCLSRAVSPPVLMGDRESPSPTPEPDTSSAADSARSSSPQRRCRFKASISFPDYLNRFHEQNQVFHIPVRPDTPPTPSSPTTVSKAGIVVQEIPKQNGHS
ncbi:LOW QUALITY PROTEIN: uncharacterized protein [Ptychodera flava]|uniref:LOW QUALITY PROTEIN: uncharacterized protein n=1 Tax=Ptychodera flava TaxID=63121 RepID=UPI00396A3D6B